MNVRPFRLLGATVLRDLDEKANEAIRGWVDAWFAAPPTALRDGVRMRATTRDSLGVAVEDQWWRIIGPHPYWVALHIPTGARRVLAEHLHGFRQAGSLPDRSSSLSQQLVNRVFLDLGQRLLTTFGMKLEAGAARTVQQAPVPSVWGQGSGAAMAEMQASGEHLLILLPPELTARGIGQAPTETTQALARRSASLDSQAVKLRAWVGDAELSVHAMQSLRVGDVIRLNCSIDQPLRLLLDAASREEKPLAKGYLGTAQGHRAVQLMRDS